MELETLYDRMNRLAQCSDAYTEKGRSLLTASMTDVLDVMRREIEETQLCRRLIFRNDQDDTISLRVAAGRVLAVSEPTSEQFLAGRSHILAQELTEQTSELVTELAAMLREFVQDAENLFVESCLPEKGGAIHGAGVTGDRLFQQCVKTGDDQGTSQRDGGLEGFAANCASVATALICKDGPHTTFEQGSEAQLVALRQFADAELEPSLTGQGNSGGDQDRCLVFAGHSGIDRSVFCARVGGGMVVMVFDSSSLEKVLGHWAVR